MKILQAVSHIAVVCVALIVAMVMLRNYRTADPNRQSAAQIEASLLGRQINGKGRVSRTGHQAIILALSIHCRFCERNAEFYQMLSQIKREKDFDLIAVVAEGSSAGTEYLRAKSISADQVLEMSAKTMEVYSTPVTIIADRNGKIEAAWVGVITEDKARQILERITGQSRGAANGHS